MKLATDDSQNIKRTHISQSSK